MPLKKNALAKTLIAKRTVPFVQQENAAVTPDTLEKMVDARLLQHLKFHPILMKQVSPLSMLCFMYALLQNCSKFRFDQRHL